MKPNHQCKVKPTDQIHPEWAIFERGEARTVEQFLYKPNDNTFHYWCTKNDYTGMESGWQKSERPFEQATDWAPYRFVTFMTNEEVVLELL